MCMNQISSLRPSMAQVLQHELFKFSISTRISPDFHLRESENFIEDSGDILPESTAMKLSEEKSGKFQTKSSFNIPKIPKIPKIQIDLIPKPKAYSLAQKSFFSIYDSPEPKKDSKHSMPIPESEQRKDYFLHTQKKKDNFFGDSTQCTGNPDKAMYIDEMNDINSRFSHGSSTTNRIRSLSNSPRYTMQNRSKSLSPLERSWMSDSEIHASSQIDVNLSRRFDRQPSTPRPISSNFNELTNSPKILKPYAKNRSISAKKLLGSQPESFFQSKSGLNKDQESIKAGFRRHTLDIIEQNEKKPNQSTPRAPDIFAPSNIQCFLADPILTMRERSLSSRNLHTPDSISPSSPSTKFSTNIPSHERKFSYPLANRTIRSYNRSHKSRFSSVSKIDIVVGKRTTHNLALSSEEKFDCIIGRLNSPQQSKCPEIEIKTRESENVDTEQFMSIEREHLSLQESNENANHRNPLEVLYLIASSWLMAARNRLANRAI